MHKAYALITATFQWPTHLIRCRIWPDIWPIRGQLTAAIQRPVGAILMPETMEDFPLASVVIF